ncbi:MAG: type II toxin-antitoxin system Phd/YefM family antitoxin [Lachnospiraceae bacterium]|nr:type II toxin-antitoxin system Phd/YefM family antitoxin [Lachnospiraceae bacterium]
MVVANYTAVRNNLKSYCDMAVDDGETIIIPRKEYQSVAIISLNDYNAMQETIKNAEYLLKLERSFKQLDEGKGTVHELIED